MLLEYEIKNDKKACNYLWWIQISKNENEALPETISVYKVSLTEFSCQFIELTHLFWKKHITVEKMLLS